MLKSILKLIEEFVIKPASITSGLLFILGFIFLYVFINRNIKKSILLSLKGTILSFIVIVIFSVVSIKLNEPKFMYLIYPFILNIWFFAFKENKYNLIMSNFFVLVAFFSDFYIVEKLLFE